MIDTGLFLSQGTNGLSAAYDNHISSGNNRGTTMQKKTILISLINLILLLLILASAQVLTEKRDNPLKQKKPTLTTAYIKQHQDQVTIKIPEMFELAHVKIIG